MPSTVPNRPMNGALLPSVPRNSSPPSKRLRRSARRLDQDLLDGVGAVAVPAQRLADDLGLDRGARGQELPRRRADRRAPSALRTPSVIAARSSRRRRKNHQRSMITPIESTDRPKQHVENRARDQRRDQDQLLHHHVGVHGFLPSCDFLAFGTPCSAHRQRVKSSASRPAPMPWLPRVSASVACHVAGFTTSPSGCGHRRHFHCADAWPHIEDASTRTMYCARRAAGRADDVLLAAAVDDAVRVGVEVEAGPRPPRPDRSCRTEAGSAAGRGVPSPRPRPTDRVDAGGKRDVGIDRHDRVQIEVGVRVPLERDDHARPAGSGRATVSVYTSATDRRSRLHRRRGRSASPSPGGVSGESDMRVENVYSSASGDSHDRAAAPERSSTRCRSPGRRARWSPSRRRRRAGCSARPDRRWRCPWSTIAIGSGRIAVSGAARPRRTGHW